MAVGRALSLKRRSEKGWRGGTRGEGWGRGEGKDGTESGRITGAMGRGAGRCPQQSTGPPEAAAGLSEAQASPGNHSSKTHGPCAQKS